MGLKEGPILPSRKWGWMSLLLSVDPSEDSEGNQSVVPTALARQVDIRFCFEFVFPCTDLFSSICTDLYRLSVRSVDSDGLN